MIETPLNVVIYHLYTVLIITSFALKYNNKQIKLQ